MEKHPIQQSLGDKQTLNQYYQNLLANQPELDLDAQTTVHARYDAPKSISSPTMRSETSRASFDGCMRQKRSKLLSM